MVPRRSLHPVQLHQHVQAGCVEIIAALHTRMIQYQTHPTPHEYRTACKRLVAKHKELVEKTAYGYVSLNYALHVQKYTLQLLQTFLLLYLTNTVLLIDDRMWCYDIRTLLIYRC